MTFPKFIWQHFEINMTCTSTLTFPWQPIFDSHVLQNQDLSLYLALSVSNILYSLRLFDANLRSRSLNFFQASFSAISLIAVYLRGSIRYLSPAGLIWFISYIICDWEVKLSLRSQNDKIKDIDLNLPKMFISVRISFPAHAFGL